VCTSIAPGVPLDKAELSLQHWLWKRFHQRNRFGSQSMRHPTHRRNPRQAVTSLTITTLLWNATLADALEVSVRTVLTRGERALSQMQAYRNPKTQIPSLPCGLSQRV